MLEKWNELKTEYSFYQQNCFSRKRYGLKKPIGYDIYTTFMSVDSKNQIEKSEKVEQEEWIQIQNINKMPDIIVSDSSEDENLILEEKFKPKKKLQFKESEDQVRF